METAQTRASNLLAGWPHSQIAAADQPNGCGSARVGARTQAARRPHEDPDARGAGGVSAATLSTEQVWVELHTNIRRFVGRRVRHSADVDDVVQRVFLQVHRALPNLRATDRLHAWIYQVARRAIVDYHRAPAHQREVLAGSALDLLPAQVGAEAADTEDERSAQQELAACLNPLLGRLAAADQEALRLVEFDGVTQVDAAGRLGLSVSGMKSRVQRARVRLRQALEDCCRVALDPRGGVHSYEGCAAGGCGPAAPGERSGVSDAPLGGLSRCCH